MSPRRRLLDLWAGYDPTGTAPRVIGIARRVPGFGELERVAEQIEQRLISDLRARTDEVLALQSGDAPDSARTPADLLSTLLHQSTVQSASENRTREYTRILERMTPDEARILAALSDRSTFAVLDVLVTGTPLKPGRVLLQNASDVGRQAGVASPERVPEYVTHLISLGIAELGTEDATLTSAYEILETDARVRAARKTAGTVTRLPPILRRHTLRITTLGETLWATATEQPRD